jgi:phage terminase large subunit-like protein
VVATQVAERRVTRPKRPSGGWWGDGPAPVKEWPGVTVDLPAVWRRGRWESSDGRYYFDQVEADRACEFFPRFLRHHIGEFAGKPFELMRYQARLLTRPLFGWKSTSTGFRRFRKLFGFIPKGAGKSPWGAGTGLYGALCDREPAAEVYAVAADRNQARVVHSNAKIMVEQSPDLADLCDVLRDSIYVRETRSTYQVLSADAATKHGFRPHFVIFDEFHAQPNRDLYEALKKSMVKRRQPLMIIITHAGDDDEGICAEEYDYAKRVLSGSVPDLTCLPVIFEAEPAEDWTSPTVWRRVNPGHGITVQAAAIEAECYEAMAEPRKKNDFLRFHLNRWVNQATAWIPLDWWDACKEPVAEDAELGALTCGAGLDLAQKWDLASFVVVFKHVVAQAQPVEVVKEDETGAVVKAVIDLNYRITLLPFFWIPQDTIREHEKIDGIPYSEWARLGLVTATEGAIIDYTTIYRDITTKILPRFPMLKQATIGYDPAFATDIATKLRDAGGLQILEVPQNYKHLSEPAYIFEALVKAKRVAHGGQRCLRWNVENVAVKRDDAGRIRPVKPKRTSKRIDGVVASIMGIKVFDFVQRQPEYQAMVFGGRGA